MRKMASSKGYMPVQSLQPFQMVFFHGAGSKKGRPCQTETKIFTLRAGEGVIFEHVDTAGGTRCGDEQKIGHNFEIINQKQAPLTK